MSSTTESQTVYGLIFNILCKRLSHFIMQKYKLKDQKKFDKKIGGEGKPKSLTWENKR